jgi:hypothetical protein
VPAGTGCDGSVSDDSAAGFAVTLGAVQVTAPPLLATARVVRVSGDSRVALTNATPGGRWSAKVKPVEGAGP